MVNEHGGAFAHWAVKDTEGCVVNVAGETVLGYFMALRSRKSFEQSTGCKHEVVYLKNGYKYKRIEREEKEEVVHGMFGLGGDNLGH